MRLTVLFCGLLTLAAFALPARAQPYSGPPDSWTAYWAVPAFSDIPYRGPEKAKGALLWSHGLFNNEVQYASPPPEIIKHLARDGWDVIKVQRNPLFERDWSASGPKHVADLQQRAREALAQGYKRIILGGQSYGGQITLDGAGGDVPIFAVLAFNPGQSSDATVGFQRKYENIMIYLLASLAKVRAERVLVLAAGNDPFIPYQGMRGPRLKQALAPRNVPYVVLDESMPIKGHFAIYLHQFDTWYGRCISDFVDPNNSYAPGEVTCAAPNPVPKFLYPRNLLVSVPPPGTRSYLGAWAGMLEDNSREAGIVVERVQDGRMSFVYGLGAGPNQDISMSAARHEATQEQDQYVARSASGRTITLRLDETAEILHLTVVTPRTRTFTVMLKRTTVP